MTPPSTESEFNRPVKIKALKEGTYVIEASPDERQALAERFSLSTLKSLHAELSLTPDGAEIVATGHMHAQWLQPCAISGDDFKAGADETIHLRFVPRRKIEPSHEEIEVELEDIDEIEFAGDSFDLGEAVAQSLGLIIDPYATGPKADAARKEKGIVKEGEEAGALADALAALKKD